MLHCFVLLGNRTGGEARCSDVLSQVYNTKELGAAKERCGGCDHVRCDIKNHHSIRRHDCDDAVRTTVANPPLDTIPMR